MDVPKKKEREKKEREKKEREKKEKERKRKRKKKKTCRVREMTRSKYLYSQLRTALFFLFTKNCSIID